MKKFLIIGNPISHSLSPKLHNYWFKESNIDGNYEKNELDKNQLEKIIQKIRKKEIFGMNVTVPFKQLILPYLETKSKIAEETNSVNTVFMKEGKIYGDNTDVYGFEKSITINELELKNKKILIFGAGGVVPSIIYGLMKMQIGKLYVSNRTMKNAEKLKEQFGFIEILEWGEVKDCDLFINSTSLGLKKDDKFQINFKNLKGNKVFYDLIYNPSKTLFLSEPEKMGHKIINGREMFLYQAQKAFNLWTDITPKIDKKLIDFLYDD
tara:strand:+ start:91 stop:888 length:798 start_codon:yes stop_codon:yes gene_type:complete